MVRLDFALQYIDPQFAILVVILYCAGNAIKRTHAVDCRWIPLLLTGIGTALAALSIFGSGKTSIASALYQAFGQGILCAGMSVYLNQVLKQIKNGK